MITLASKDVCSGCGLCAFKCPTSSIKMQENTIGEVYPNILQDTCIECHACEKACPILNPLEVREPYIAYAAHSNDEHVRRHSASGGIAMTAYQYALEKGYYVCGAVQNKDFSVQIKMATNIEDAQAFQNSKYVFSEVFPSFRSIIDALKEGKKVLVIALPCQVAAIRKACHDNDNLITGEVVCHGTTPFSYLSQHVKSIEKKEECKASKMYFRDPNCGTHLFYFSLYDVDNNCFYAKRTKDGDSYQYGYHRNISYRENCYHCFFAKKQRQADFTINDYKQLGKLAPTSFLSRQQLSSILINTSKGETFISEMINNGLLVSEVRPIDEPINADARLREPTAKKASRLLFEKRIVECNGDFELAISPIALSGLRKERIENCKKQVIDILRKIKKRII